MTDCATASLLTSGFGAFIYERVVFFLSSHWISCSLARSVQMGLRPASETDTDVTTSDDISSSSASEISDSSLDEVVDAKTGAKQFVPRQLDEDGMVAWSGGTI